MVLFEPGRVLNRFRGRSFEGNNYDILAKSPQAYRTLKEKTEFKDKDTKSLDKLWQDYSAGIGSTITPAMIPIIRQINEPQNAEGYNSALADLDRLLAALRTAEIGFTRQLVGWESEHLRPELPKPLVKKEPEPDTDSDSGEMNLEPHW